MCLCCLDWACEADFRRLGLLCRVSRAVLVSLADMSVAVLENILSSLFRFVLPSAARSLSDSFIGGVLEADDSGELSFDAVFGALAVALAGIPTDTSGTGGLPLVEFPCAGSIGCSERAF